MNHNLWRNKLTFLIAIIDFRSIFVAPINLNTHRFVQFIILCFKTIFYWPDSNLPSRHRTKRLLIFMVPQNIASISPPTQGVGGSNFLHRALLWCWIPWKKIGKGVSRWNQKGIWTMTLTEEIHLDCVSSGLKNCESCLLLVEKRIVFLIGRNCR